jgi:ubiquinone/menaquinone biosynthesis C-methylase UbiE
MKHNYKIQEQFNEQAPIFSQQPTIANLDHTQWMLNLIKLKSDDKVLDVAAGTDSFSRAIAPLVKTVIALDLTPSMLEQGRLETVQAGLTNVQFE